MVSPSAFEKVESRRYHSCPCCKRRGQLRVGTAQSFQECSPGCARKASTSEDSTRLVGEGRNHVRVRFCLRRVLRQRGPLHVHFFSGGACWFLLFQDDDGVVAFKSRLSFPWFQLYDTCFSWTTLPSSYWLHPCTGTDDGYVQSESQVAYTLTRLRTVYVAYRIVNSLLDRVVDVISSGAAIHVALDGSLSNRTAFIEAKGFVSEEVVNRPDNLTVAFLASLSESMSMLWRAELIGDSGLMHTVSRLTTSVQSMFRGCDRMQGSTLLLLDCEGLELKPEMRGYNRTGAFAEQLLPLQESHAAKV